VRSGDVIATLVLGLAISGCHERRAPDAHAPDRVAAIREQHLPNVELVTHEGRHVRFYDDLVKGRVVAINFMFATCRRACPVATEHLVEVQTELAERRPGEVTFLSISLEPERDTPEVLRGFAAAHGVGPGWLFLTGRRDDVERLRRALGAYDPDPVLDADRSQHGGIVILGNEPRGRWKAISALSKPVRIRQAIERTILPPSAWPTGPAVVAEAPYEDRDAPELADLTDLRPTE
jgi:protein SCO1/2